MESLLKKDFKESDIRRARALISGQYSESTQTLVGYEEESQTHKEGDVWIQDGKEWTIEDGIRVSRSKLGRAREYSRLPLTCPKCGKALSTRLDAKVYPLHGVCYECLVKFEDELKRAGMYQKYEQAIISGNIRSFIADIEKGLEAMKSDLVVDTVTENGEVEHWGSISAEFESNAKEWLELLSKTIE